MLFSKNQKMAASAIKILVVDDEPAIRDMIQRTLELSCFVVQTAENADQCSILLYDFGPDLVLLDWMMPGTSGIDLLRRWRRDETVRDVPVIMLTAKTDEDSRVLGLEVGADDFVAKPFSPRELVARVHAVLRRGRAAAGGEVIEQGGVRIDPDAVRVQVEGEEVKAGPIEFRLLQFFVQNPDRVFSRAQLLDNVWGANVYIDERTVDVHIRRLRKLLDSTGKGYSRYICTVRGSGYRFSVIAGDQ